MQQVARSFHGAFRDMGTHDISTFQGTLIFQYFNKLQTSTSSRSFFATQADVSLALDLADAVGKKAWGADCPAQLAAAERLGRDVYWTRGGIYKFIKFSKVWRKIGKFSAIFEQKFEH